ncbi:MAG: sulfite exporter TauE/SafE family protein [Promethearchaeota archaeon]
MNITWFILLLIIIGIIVGLLKTIAGAGGGVFFVSIMVLYLGLPFHIARDTSIFIMLIGSFTAFVFYLKQNRINMKLTLIFSFFSILGSFSCWIFLIFYPISNDLLKIVFSIVLIVTACNLFLKIYWDKKNNAYEQKGCEEFNLDDEEFKKQVKMGIPFFFLAGIMAHLLGIGGGVINTPTCHLILGLPIHTATATSAGIMFFTASFNFILKVFFGEINYLIGIILAIGTVLGAIIGAKISYKMPQIQLQAFVGIMLIFLGLNMLFSI